MTTERIARWDELKTKLFDADQKVRLLQSERDRSRVLLDDAEKTASELWEAACKEFRDFFGH